MAATYQTTINGQTFETATRGRVRITVRKGAEVTRLDTGVTYPIAFRCEWFGFRLPDGDYLVEHKVSGLLRVHAGPCVDAA